VSGVRVWRALLGIEHAVIEGVELDEVEGGQAVVVSVRPGRRQRGRWRHVDAGVLPVWLEADAPRVSCPGHGVVVAHVPWARHSRGTRPRSTTPSPGWPWRPRSPRCVSCCGSRGARSGRSSPGSRMRPRRLGTRCRGCGGSGSMRSRHDMRVILTIVVDHDREAAGVAATDPTRPARTPRRVIHPHIAGW